LFLLFTGLVFLYRLALLLHHVLPTNLELFRVLIVSCFVPRMVDAHQPATDLGATYIVDGQVGAALILVLEPSEALGFACFLVANQFEEGGFTKLGEDGDDVAFGELVW
jgi:hypothetical protein